MSYLQGRKTDAGFHSFKQEGIYGSAGEKGVQEGEKKI